MGSGIGMGAGPGGAGNGGSRTGAGPGGAGLGGAGEGGGGTGSGLGTGEGVGAGIVAVNAVRELAEQSLISILQWPKPKVRYILRKGSDRYQCADVFGFIQIDAGTRQTRPADRIKPL